MYGRQTMSTQVFYLDTINSHCSTIPELSLFNHQCFVLLSVSCLWDLLFTSYKRLDKNSNVFKLWIFRGSMIRTVDFFIFELFFLESEIYSRFFFHSFFTNSIHESWTTDLLFSIIITKFYYIVNWLMQHHSSEMAKEENTTGHHVL